MVETPGRGPGGSRFESGRSHCEGTGCSGVSYALHAGSIPALATTCTTPGPVAQLGSAAPLQGEGCGFESRAVHSHADVAQQAEARRPDRRQCRFESDRQYHLDVAQRERTGFGSRWLEVRALPGAPLLISARAMRPMSSASASLRLLHVHRARLPRSWVPLNIEGHLLTGNET